jgi:Cu(I)/Ag(I) efflux system membrane fusion protein
MIMPRITMRAALIGPAILALGALLVAALRDPGHTWTAAKAEEKAAGERQPSSQPKAGERRVKFYRNPMGLPDISSTPKKDSMGMDYIPVYEDEHNDSASVTIPLGKLQRTGVETVTAVKQRMNRTIKAPGVVQFDEKRVFVLSPRFDGYVESIGPATTGSRINSGDPLVTVYGQDVLDQGARLVIEERASGKGESRSDNAAENFSARGAIGARRRLLNLGVPAEYINSVIRERRVPDTLTFRADRGGVVVERAVVAGQAFKAGDTLFRIADLSQVWVIADVPEGEFSELKSGSPVIVRTRAHPGKTFTGTLTLIYPRLMSETRTIRVRIELQNPDQALLPEMYCDVEIASSPEDAVVTVPDSAVIDSGSRQAVLLDLGEGRYEPRNVKLGRRGDGLSEILEGVSEGDRIVARGNFLIDSESNLQSALKSLSAPAAME